MELHEVQNIVFRNRNMKVAYYSFLETKFCALRFFSLTLVVHSHLHQSRKHLETSRDKFLDPPSMNSREGTFSLRVNLVTTFTYLPPPGK